MGHKLGQWILVQRHRALGPERRARLEALPGWTWDLHEADWEEGYARLERFAERTGHTRIPAKYRDGDGFRLGGWVVRQRQGQKHGELSAERARRLEGLPGWTWDLFEASWVEGFARLLAFVEREGHSRVPGSYRDDGYRLGRWVIKQRQAYRHGKLDRERRARLQALPGWVWKTRKPTADD
jgi:hypothetical protein